MNKKKAAQPKAGTSSAKPAGLVPYDEIGRLVDFLEERGLEEFEFEQKGVRIRLRRSGGMVPAGAGPVMPAPAATAPAAAPAPAAPAGSSAPAASEAEDEGLHVIKSPIVGTFYSSPRPDAPSFVQVGDRVEVGQVLCIVEAMKLMNEIESDVAGEVVRVYGTNAHPVEYGESLFAIRVS